MRLIYIYHSCFVLMADNCAVVMDYFRDTDENPQKGWIHSMLLRRPGPLYVLASHFHPDHYKHEIFDWQTQKSDIHYILSHDILKRRRAKAAEATFLNKGDEYKDDNIEIKAFGSTDTGCSFRIHVDGRTVFHAGDLNNWAWVKESTPEEVKKAEDDYLKELADLAAETPKIDLAMFPVDPRMETNYMRGAEQLVEKIPVTIFVPMHFWERPKEVDGFAKIAESHNTRFLLLSHPGEGVELRF